MIRLRLRSFLTVFTALATAALAMAVPAQAADIWRPPVESRWQYQLEGNPDYPETGGINVEICEVPQSGGACVRPTVFDIDLYAAEEAITRSTRSALSCRRSSKRANPSSMWSTALRPRVSAPSRARWGSTR